MLVFDQRVIGNRLLAIRKRMGLTQAEVAEESGLSDRTYADIERGGVNMRTETMLRICRALHVTPDVILTEEHSDVADMQVELWDKLSICTPRERETAMQLLAVYLKSLDK